MSLSYITFISNDGDGTEKKRKITVVDGVIYYQSSGENSGFPGVWFPIFGLKGSSDIKLDTLLSHYNPAYFRILKFKETKGHFIKLNSISLSPKFYEKFPFEKLDVETCIYFKERIPTKHTFVTSARLGDIPANVIDKSTLNEKEKSLATNKLLLNETTDFETFDPDIVNLWAYLQGAAHLEGTLFPKIESNISIANKILDLLEKENEKIKPRSLLRSPKESLLLLPLKKTANSNSLFSGEDVLSESSHEEKNEKFLKENAEEQIKRYKDKCEKYKLEHKTKNRVREFLGRPTIESKITTAKKFSDLMDGAEIRFRPEERKILKHALSKEVFSYYLKP